MIGHVPAPHRIHRWEPPPKVVSSDASGWHSPANAWEDPYARYGVSHDYAADYEATLRWQRFIRAVHRVLRESGAGAFGGGGMVAAGGLAIIASGPVGWVGGVVATMMIAGGTASMAIGGEHILLNALNAGSYELQAEMGEGAAFARHVASPGVLVGGTIGAGVGGEGGLSTGMAIGGAIESVVLAGASTMQMGAGAGVGADSMVLFHGTTEAGAQSILSKGMLPVSIHTAPFPAGSFFTHAGAEGQMAATHWAARSASLYGGKPVVLRGTMSQGLFDSLSAQGLIKTRPVPGLPFFPPQTVILPEGLGAANGGTQWSIAPLTF